MATSSDPDRRASDSPTKPEDNPFIRFRKFADAQVGSLLQGIIGLPSAFSRKEAGGSQWDTFDEDLRRRDELQAKQREMRHSEPSERPLELHAGEDKAVNTKDSSVRTGHGGSSSGNGVSDVPLYSPVSKCLFAHLEQSSSPSTEWPTRDVDINTFLKPGILAINWQSNQLSSDVIGMTQKTVYNELEASSTFRSNYSVLPYLMFSPYSPLRLAEASRRTSVEGFPYHEAFEDLLRHQQDATRRPPTINLLPPHLFTLGFLGSGPVGLVAANMSWIANLYSSNLLQEKEEKIITQIPELPSARSLQHQETEQDMYEQFLRRAGSNAFVYYGTSLLESILQEFEHNDIHYPRQGLKVVNEIIKALDTRSEQITNELTDFSKDLQKLWQVNSPFDRGLERESGERTPRQTQNTDRVTSSTTTTTRTVNDDGSVGTTVTVHKSFADGRSTTTTTEHLEEPAEEELDAKAGRRSQATEHATTTAEEQRTVSRPKGWFWS